MLYQAYAVGRCFAQPANVMAESMKIGLDHPFNPWRYTPVGRNALATADLVERFTREYTKPVFGIDQVETATGTAEIVEEPVRQEAFCTLKHFRKANVSDPGPRILLVAPASGHYATLLRGTVRRLLPEADVYITDWMNARDVPVEDGEFDLDVYLDYLQRFLDTLGAQNTHVMAVCQPAPLVLALAAIRHQTNRTPPRSITLMGGPVDTEAAPTEVTELADDNAMAWFEDKIHEVPAGYTGFGRRVYPGFLQLAGFLTMNLSRHQRSHMDYFNHLVAGDGDSAEAHRRFYDEFLAVRDEPATYFLQTVDAFFHRNALARGDFRHRGLRVDPGIIDRTAVMTIEGENDDISAPGQTSAAHRLCVGLPESRKVHHLEPGCGHYGQFNGRRWRENIAPAVLDFVNRN